MSSLQPLLGAKTKSLVGVDIGSSAVKVLQLARRGQTYIVTACAIEPLAQGTVAEDGRIPDAATVAAAVGNALRRSGCNAREAAVAVPTTLVIDKHISLAAGLREQDMEDQIRAEADQYISFPVEDVHLDFTATDQAGEDDSSTDVLLVACRNEDVESRAAAVELAGLQARVVDVETYALEGACQLLRKQLPDGGAGHTVVLVDVGAQNLSMLVLEDGRHVYAHEQSFGGALLTEDIARHFEMNAQQAEQAKRANELPPAYAAELLPRFFDDMAQQIQRALQYFYSDPGMARRGAVDHLLLAGGCARLPGVVEALGEQLRLPVQIAEPLASAKASGRARARQLRDEGPALMLAAGLALRAFDEPR